MSYFGHASLFLPDFDAFVLRLPKGTQANSQVCFRWMSKWWINEYRENLELYHTKKNAAENNYYSKVFVTVKTCSSFLNLLVQGVLILFWKYLLVKEEELFCLWKVSKFLLATLFANARSVDVSKLRVEKKAILRLRPRKQIFLLFSKKKVFCENNLHQITYLPKAIMDRKWRKWIFQLLPLDGRYFLTVALNSLSKKSWSFMDPVPGHDLKECSDTPLPL